VYESERKETGRRLNRSSNNAMPATAKTFRKQSLKTSPSKTPFHSTPSSPIYSPLVQQQRRTGSKRKSTTIRVQSSPSMMNTTINNTPPHTNVLGVTGDSPMLETLDDNEDPDVLEYLDDLVESISSESDILHESPHFQQLSRQLQNNILSPIRNNKFIKFLLKLEIDPIDAVEYQKKLNKEGFSSVASIRCSKLKNNDLIELGIKRGHAALILHELEKISKKAEFLNEDDDRVMFYNTSNNERSFKQHLKSPTRAAKHNKLICNHANSNESILSSPDEDDVLELSLYGEKGKKPSIPDPKRFDTMTTPTLCSWLDTISLGQYKPMVRRLRLNGSRLLSMTEVELKKIISNRFHRQHLRNSAQSSQMEHQSISKLIHNSNSYHGNMSMCVCEACVFAAKQRKPRHVKSNRQIQTK
jgi:hypothetical protein